MVRTISLSVLESIDKKKYKEALEHLFFQVDFKGKSKPLAGYKVGMDIGIKTISEGDEGIKFQISRIDNFDNQLQRKYFNVSIAVLKITENMDFSESKETQAKFKFILRAEQRKYTLYEFTTTGSAQIRKYGAEELRELLNDLARYIFSA